MTKSDSPYHVFDIVLIPFPFTDLSIEKKRPALILSQVAQKSARHLFSCCMITSQIEGEKITGDYLLKDWQKAGLLHPSKIRVAKIVTIEDGLVLKKIGALLQGDQAGVKKAFRTVFEKWN